MIDNNILNIYKQLSYKNPFVPNFGFAKIYQRLWYELDKLAATFIIFFAIKLNLKANTISISSYIITLPMALIYFTDILILQIISFAYLMLVHSWDWADGYIARHNNSQGLLGHIHDEIGGVLIVDILYFWVATILLRYTSVFSFLSIPILLSLLFRFIKIKNLFYRIMNNNNEMTNNEKSNNLKDEFVSEAGTNFLKQFMYFVFSNDYRFFTISVIIAFIYKPFIYILFFIYFFYGVANFLRIVRDIRWTLDPF